MMRMIYEAVITMEIDATMTIQGWVSQTPMKIGNSATNPENNGMPIETKPPSPGGEKPPAGRSGPSVGGDGAPSLLPPPASYELPDEYAETWFDGAKRWVDRLFAC